MEKDKLSLLVGVLSILVTYQSLVIVSNFDNFSSGKGNSELNIELRNKLENQARRDLESFVQDQEIKKGAQVWMEAKDINPEKNEKEIYIWLDTKYLTKIVDLKFSYNQYDVLLVDSDTNRIGKQIVYGDAPVYLVNDFDANKGEINIAADFQDGFRGRKLLGVIKLFKKEGIDKTEIRMIYNGSKEESYVSGENGENILSEGYSMKF